MSKALIDNFTKEELEKMVADSLSMRELERKIGYSAIGNNSETVQSRLDLYNISTDHFTGISPNNVKRTEENVFIENSTATQATLRRWYKKGRYTEYKCSICGLEPFWNGRELTLTLDHINGNNHDDRLENLRWVCPNCDRQLPTFGSKNPHSKEKYNKKDKITSYCINCGIEIAGYGEKCPRCAALERRKVERPTKEELFNILNEEKGCFAAVARKFGVADNTIRKWCKAYELPFHSSNYKQVN